MMQRGKNAYCGNMHPLSKGFRGWPSTPIYGREWVFIARKAEKGKITATATRKNSVQKTCRSSMQKTNILCSVTPTGDMWKRPFVLIMRTR